MEISEVEIPEVMIDRQIDDEVSEFDYRLKMQGLSLDKYFEFANTSLEKLKSNLKKDLVTKLSLTLYWVNWQNRKIFRLQKKR